MSNNSQAWQITDTDIELVLLTHNLNADDSEVARARETLDEEAIIDRLLMLSEFDEQCDSALCDIEDALMQEGIIPPDADKQFDSPVV